MIGQLFQFFGNENGAGSVLVALITGGSLYLLVIGLSEVKKDLKSAIVGFGLFTTFFEMLVSIYLEALGQVHIVSISGAVQIAHVLTLPVFVGYVLAARYFH